MTLLPFFFHPQALHCSNFIKSVLKASVCKRLLAEEGLNQGGLSVPTRLMCKQGQNTSVCSAASGILHQDTETLVGMFLRRFVLSRALCSLQGVSLLLLD